MGSNNAKNLPLQFHTPITQKTAGSVFDPRSPSCGIDRTPIEVSETPKDAVEVIDPRSPTTGIMRTPIYELGGVWDSAPTSTPFGPPVVKSLDYSNMDVDSGLEESPLTNDETVDSFYTAPSSIEDGETPTTFKEDKPAPAKKSKLFTKKKLFSKLSKNQSSDDSMDNSLSSGRSTSSSSSSTQGCEVSPRTPLKTISSTEALRTPFLTTNVIHSDSPSAIVRRKQTTKLSKFRGQLGNAMMTTRSPHKYQMMEDEKENN